jgi:hypothetical protein
MQTKNGANVAFHFQSPVGNWSLTATLNALSNFDGALRERAGAIFGTTGGRLRRAVPRTIADAVGRLS